MTLEFCKGLPELWEKHQEERTDEPMSAPELEHHARQALAWASEQLAQEKGLDPFVRFVYSADRVTQMAVPGSLMESPKMKSLLFAANALAAAKTHARALITVTDAWTLTYSAEHEAKPEQWWKESSDYAFKHGVVAAAKAGYGELTEIINSMAETTERALTVVQPYRRFAADGLIPPTAAPPHPPHRIQMGEIKVISSGENEVGGRAFALYQAAQAVRGKR